MWLCWDWAYKIIYYWEEYLLKEDGIIYFLLNNPLRLEKYTEINVLEKLCFYHDNNFLLFSNLILKDKFIIIINIIIFIIIIIIIIFIIVFILLKIINKIKNN